MSATAAMIAELRLMVNEPDNTTYDDDALEARIEEYPLIDQRGEEPITWDTSTSPPSQDANEDWIATYDLHSAAAKIWAEKAAGVAQEFTFSADGGQYVRSEKHKQFMSMARHHMARRAARNLRAVSSWPKGIAPASLTWVSNLVESESG